jgi:hypothetical protein
VWGPRCGRTGAQVSATRTIHMGEGKMNG